MKKKVLLAANISNAFREELIRKKYELIVWNDGQLPQDVLGIITSNKLKLDKHKLATLKQLKWIARLGSGIEIIDTAYCQEHDIAFASSPAGIANAVAEHCIAMLISLHKNIVRSFQEIKNKAWVREENRGWELEGKTVGLIGYGNTGRAFAKKLAVFGVTTLAYDRYTNGFTDEFATEVKLNELQERSDILSFHVPLNKETENYYNKNFISTCKEHILLNTSRGEIVHTTDLLQALKNGTVLGAALDVLDIEKELSDSKSTAWEIVEELLNYKVLITPHIAGYSHNAIEKMSIELMQKLKDVI